MKSNIFELPKPKLLRIYEVQHIWTTKGFQQEITQPVVSADNKNISNKYHCAISYTVT